MFVSKRLYNHPFATPLVLSSLQSVGAMSLHRAAHFPLRRLAITPAPYVVITPCVAHRDYNSSQRLQQQKQESTDSSQSHKASETNRSPATRGAQPKIIYETPPEGDQVPKDVEEHNREMDRRADKPHEKVTLEGGRKDK